MAKAAWWEEAGKEAILWLWEYFAMTTLGVIVIAIWGSLWLSKRLRTHWPQIAPVASWIALLFGLFFSAAALMIQDQFVRQAPLIEKERQEDARRKAEEDRKREEATPQYLEQKIRGWLDKHKYATQSLDPKPNERFRLRATADQEFTIFQEKDIAGGVTILTVLDMQQPFAKQLLNLSNKRRSRLFDEIQIQLLQLGPQNNFQLDPKSGAFRIVIWSYFAMDATTTRDQFISQLWLLKRSKGAAELVTKRFFEYG